MDAQWQETVKTISTSGALSPGVIALQPFLQSEKYSEQARDVAISLLSSSSDRAFFDSLFGTALDAVDWRHFNKIIQLSRALNAKMDPLIIKSFDPTKDVNDLDRLTKEEVARYQYGEAVIPIISSRIGALLRTPKPPQFEVDLSAVFIKLGDWRGVNLEGANLEGTRISWVDLQDADLKGISKFSGLIINNTAWWEVKSISRPLLEYLKKQYPYVPGSSYGPRDTLPTQTQYDAAILRLEKASG